MRRVLQILMCICFTLVLAADAAAGETSLVVHPDGSWEQYEDGSGLAENTLSLGYICELGSDASADTAPGTALPPMVPSLTGMAGMWEGETLTFSVDEQGSVLRLDTGETGFLDQGKLVIGEHTWFLQKSLWPAEDFLPEEIRAFETMETDETGYVFFPDILYAYELGHGEGVSRQLLYRTGEAGV